MEAGIGLPSTVAGVEPAALVEWARRGEQRGFSTLAVLDRLLYRNPESLVTLAVAAAVTSRIRLTTSILIAPLRCNALLLAKQAASVDRISGGRLVLGVGLGGRADDYEASGLPTAGRGARLERTVERLREVWSEGRVGPSTDGPPLLIGGHGPRAFERAAAYGAGWIGGSEPAPAFRRSAEQVRDSWSRAGRAGAPRLVAMTYYALGDRAREHADRYLEDYFAFAPGRAATIARSVPTTGEAVAGVVRDFAAAGCDELIFFPCDGDPRQVDLLADALDG